MIKYPHQGDLSYLSASIRRAMEDLTVPELISIFGWFTKEGVNLYFYLSEPVSEQSEEELYCISTEVVSDFHKFWISETFAQKKPENRFDMVEVYAPK